MISEVKFLPTSLDYKASEIVILFRGPGRSTSSLYLERNLGNEIKPDLEAEGKNDSHNTINDLILP